MTLRESPGMPQTRLLLAQCPPGEDKWAKITETPAAAGADVEVQVSQEFFDIVGREISKQPNA